MSMSLTREMVMMLTSGSEYRIAFVREDGEWDIVERIMALSDADANGYADRHYGDQEWYVLDRHNRNINGGSL